MTDKIRWVVATMLIVAIAVPVSAHEADVIGAGGKVGPIRTGETTVRAMRDLLGEPSQRDVVRVGCSRVIKLRWRGQIQAYAYRADDDRRVIDVKVLSRRVDTAEGTTYSFHTRKELRVGDSKRRLKNKYPNVMGERHNGHTHFILGQSDNGTKLLAKVVGGEVVQLEAAPYEFC